MPPKKKKPSKKDQAEAEELRKRQEEEARQKELQAKRERELYEKQQREALDVLFKEQAPSLQQQEQQLLQVITTLRQRWLDLAHQRRETGDWESFMNCDTKPNPASESALNSFLTVWTENEQCGYINLNEFIEKLDQVDEICTLIERELATVSDAGDRQAPILHHLQCQTRLLANRCWDKISTDIYQNMDQFPVEENENFKYIAQSNGHRFGLWANSSKNPRFKSIEFPDLNMTSSIPKPLSLANVGVRMLLQSHPSVVHLFEEHTDYAPIGSVLFFDLFELPPAVHRSHGWQIKQKIEVAKRLEYPFPKSAIEVVEEDPDSVTAMMQWPAAVQFHIPTTIMMQKDAFSVMWWDEKAKEWSAEGVEDPDIALSTGAVRFRSSHFAPTAVVHHAFHEYPLQQWTLKCQNTNEATLILQGKHTEIEIAIREGECQLVRPLEQLDDEVFNGTWMTPSLLFQKMAFAGLNFIGPDERAKTVKAKPAVVSNQLALGAALFSPMFQFRKSPLNSQLDPTKSVMLYQANSSAMDDTTTAWTTIVVDSKFETLSANYMICYLLADVKAPEDVRFDTQNTATATLYHLLRNAEGASNYESVHENSSVFIQTVYNVLRIVKPCAL